MNRKAAVSILIASPIGAACSSRIAGFAPSPQVASDSRIAESIATVPAPRITGVAGITSSDAGITNGRADEPCGKSYNGGMVMNDRSGVLPWKIQGAFGASPGTVKIANTVIPAKWTATELTIDPALPSYDAGPYSSWLTVTTQGGTATIGISVIPAVVNGRVFGQCTWHVAVTRIKMGKLPSPGAYAGYSGITSAWVPTVGDQLQWTLSSGMHTAIIVAVSNPVASGKNKTWTLTISQYNAGCGNSLSVYTDTFVSSGSSIVKYPQSSASKTNSTLFYR